jgi:NhaP-type Na+/H+ or K+/H+ antiporter
VSSCDCDIAGGGPKQLRTIIEAEALLNDASSITLFQVFLAQTTYYARHEIANTEITGEVIRDIIINILKLTAGTSCY